MDDNEYFLCLQGESERDSFHLMKQDIAPAPKTNWLALTIKATHNVIM